LHRHFLCRLWRRQPFWLIGPRSNIAALDRSVSVVGMTETLLVALVDDDASVRKAVGRLLTVAGLRVESFASGEDFLSSLSVRVPDCLILDLHMPGLTGLDVVKQIVRTQLMLPIVIITAFDEAESKAQCLAAGACDYLQKPLDDQILLAAVAAAVRGGTVRNCSDANESTRG
jgi:FixJ family two-component response regulator